MASWMKIQTSGRLNKVIVPGDLVKHADWKSSPINSYRDGVGFVVSYDSSEPPLPPVWVVVRWLPHDSSSCKTVYHVDSLVKVS